MCHRVENSAGCFWILSTWQVPCSVFIRFQCCCSCFQTIFCQGNGTQLCRYLLTESYLHLLLCGLYHGSNELKEMGLSFFYLSLYVNLLFYWLSCSVLEENIMLNKIFHSFKSEFSWSIKVRSKMSEHIYLNAFVFFPSYSFITLLWHFSRSSPHAFRGCSVMPHSCHYFSELCLGFVVTTWVQDQGNNLRKTTHRNLS